MKYCQEKDKYETLCEELRVQKESEIEELQSNLSRLQAVSNGYSDDYCSLLLTLSSNIIYRSSLHLQFLARIYMLRRVLAIDICPSVCLCVCQTRVL